MLRVGEKRNAYRILMGKPEEKKPLERPGYRWGNNIITNWMDWLGLNSYGSGEGREGDKWRAVANTVMNIQRT